MDVYIPISAFFPSLKTLVLIGGSARRMIEALRGRGARYACRGSVVIGG
jgi:hypothetical protein